MAENINTYLKNLSYKFFLNPKSVELSRIENSINNLKRAINHDLGEKINRIFVFGSYDRKTILPRKYDEKSDIDIIVISTGLSVEEIKKLI